MADALPDMAPAQPQAHPDAQATVTDFLDYTEFYPSDLARSLTLIKKLDAKYLEATAKVHQLTALYGTLPSLAPAERPDPEDLRKQISIALDEASRARESSSAEAVRLYENTERHNNRLITIRKKLQALPEPPSRDPTPVPVSPQTTRARKEAERTPRIMLHVPDTPRPRTTSTARVQKHRERKRRAMAAIVPGQVMPAGSGLSPAPSGSDFDMPASPTLSDFGDDLEGEAPGRVKIPKDKKLLKPKAQKAPRGPRPPGVMGTNVHSQVAGISTSNALAQLTPPPPDAKPGSKWAPWHKLTEYEMAVLRKSMKKNAIWQPSDTMIRRELSAKGRGWENYKKAREEADANGEPLLDEAPMDPNKEVLDPGETSFKPLGKEEQNLINRGMKLNEMKKLKREATLREQAARDAQEVEDATRRMAEAGAQIKSLFDGPPITPFAVDKKKDAVPRSARKRKRESVSEATQTSESRPSETPAPAPEEVPRSTGPKKLKLNPPASPPNDVEAAEEAPLEEPDDEEMLDAPDAPAAPDVPDPPDAANEGNTSQVPLAPEGPVSSNAPSAAASRAHSPAPSPIQTQPPAQPQPQPQLPAPPRQLSLPLTTTAAGTRSRRTSVAPNAKTSTPHPEEPRSTPAPSTDPATVPHDSIVRPRSHGAASAKAASAEPPVKRDMRELRELRRASNSSLPSPAEQQHKAVTSAPAAGAPLRASGRRGGRRPAPGVPTADEDGKSKVVVGRRKAAPGKKKAAGRGGNGSGSGGEEKADALASTAMQDEVAEDIDPDEARYCLCDDVSYGTMVACENEGCPREWFHLACVGITGMPRRRAKWYCPECRAVLKVDEFGNPLESDENSAGKGGKRR
ncbi:uncharacterized protein K452DRAFT_322619 [Aplosporella prunicola CBS 121167]|uniref:PHD-type domain-containing protein n=1 Tax=Aplosporella prunicola CBS 121167 TaxID=1176127 RepID=A0A6A6AY96_9PEZI|nr:uncharacterized protein K452DRAFT_322619 [Aplosporella prunicola CBS 121167]KAF2136153.1 hypothetical protein K452DRAFT_322619 [Aplosporella prunicola CBS 121167]